MCTLSEAKQNFTQALYMWHHLLGIQERIYGENRRELTTVHRKLAVMYSQVQNPRSSVKFFDDAQKLLQLWIDDAPEDGTSEDMLKDMKKDMAAMYLQSYFAANDANDIPKAIEKIQKVTELKIEITGEESQEVISNYFLTA